MGAAGWSNVRTKGAVTYPAGHVAVSHVARRGRLALVETRRALSESRISPMADPPRGSM